MKIAILNTNQRLIGGVESCLLRLIRALRERGHEVEKGAGATRQTGGSGDEAGGVTEDSLIFCGTLIFLCATLTFQWCCRAQCRGVTSDPLSSTNSSLYCGIIRSEAAIN